MTTDDWSKTCELGRMSVSRALIHMRTGLFSASKADLLHAAVLERIPINFTPHIKGSRLRMGSQGVVIDINPGALDSDDIPNWAARLRHAEQHLILQHPKRKRALMDWCFKERQPFIEDLFHFAAEIEINDFMSGKVDPGTLRRDLVDWLPEGIPFQRGMSAESLYMELRAEWTKDKTPFERLLQDYDACCDRDWCHRTSEDVDGGVKTRTEFGALSWNMMMRDVDRILIMARESMTPKEVAQVQEASNDDNNTNVLDDAFNNNGIEATDLTTLANARAELERIAIKMHREDPFFSEVLSNCLVEITDTVPKSGVHLLKKHIVLAINPSFFMQELPTTEMRGGVIKHELLHIILKHVIQAQSTAFPNKKLYGIAADLEANQYIGHPWTLPKDAILPQHFQGMSLPLNETASTYYDLLQKAIDNPKQNKKSAQQLESLQQQQNNSGNGHSDHRGWGQQGMPPQPGNQQQGSGNQSQNQQGSANQQGSQGQQEGTGNQQDPKNQKSNHNQQESRNQQQGSGNQQRQCLMNGIGNASIGDLPAHDQNIEELLQQSIAATKNSGSIPGHLLDLSAAWLKARQPAIDWKKKLRVFAKSSSKYTKKSTHRKKNKRYFRWMRQMLSTSKISADALFYLASNKVDTMPNKTWDSVNSGLKEIIRSKNISVNDGTVIEWQTLPLRVLYQLLEAYPDWAWPTWNDISNDILLRFSIIRTPLDNDDLPPNIIIMLAGQYPEVLPPVDWSHFGSARKGFIKKDFPSVYELEEISWSILPSQLIIWLIHNTDLLKQLTWQDVPPQMLVGNPYYQYNGQEAFFVERKIAKTLPGTKKQKEFPKLLCILDTSGSVSKIDVEYLFAEVHKLYKYGVEVYILEADTHPQLFWKYEGQKPYSGGGGTDFTRPLQWVNDARSGVETPVMRNGTRVNETVRLTFDGIVYLTDGYASAPTVQPYCKLMWIITPESGSGTTRYVENTPYHSIILQLPAYDKR